MARHVLKGPREMFTLRRVFAFWAMVAFVLGLAAEVHAQTVAIPATGVTRRPNRGGNLTNLQINYEDCHVNEEITFNLTLTMPPSSGTLETWAGANCDVLNNRLTPSLQTCWKIGEGVSSTAVAQTVKVHVRDLLLYRTQITGVSSVSGTSGTGGADSTGGADAGTDAAVAGGGTGGSAGTSGAAGSTSSTLTADEAACTPKDSNTAAQTITLYFMIVDSSSMILGTYAKWTPTYKLLAPAPPDKVSADIGENLLPISFSYNTTVSDLSITGYNFYCDPPPGTAAAADAGVLPVDGGVPVTNCNGVPSAVLIQGVHGTTLSEYQCGRTGSSATHGNAVNLVNGVAYNVAVATTDSYNNVGVLSVATCKVPQPVTGFYKAYTAAGGTGGGGFCSFARHREKVTLFALLGCAACLFLRRRRAA